MKENPKLYEINTIVWLDELSRRYGRALSMGTVPSEQWDILKNLGFDYIWLMGVWKRSKAGVEIFRNSPEWQSLKAGFDSALPGWTSDDVAGSPYSIASYVPDPMIGNREDLVAAKEDLHKHGMKLILDFVPNHTAPDHPWVLEHPDYYLQGTDDDLKRSPESFNQVKAGDRLMNIVRGKDPFFPPWSDTAQLNYFNPELRSAMISQLNEIAGYCDGVRCDMAMLVLNDIFDKNWGWAKEKSEYENPRTEFWQDARSALPDMILIAEAYWDTELRLQQMGFDYVYDKKLYDQVIGASASEVNHHLKSDVSYQKKLVRFIENHDEPRSAAVFGPDKLKAAAALLATLPGMKLYHHGQLEGKKIKIPMQLCRITDETADKELMDFYKKLLFITSQDIFSDGRWELKDVYSSGDESFKNLIAFVWASAKNEKLIVVNVNEYRSQGRISLKKEISGYGNYGLHDELNDLRYVRNGREMADPGLHVVLEVFQSHIFDISPNI
jgi:hypothetical protein